MASKLVSVLKIHALRVEQQLLSALGLRSTQNGGWPPGVAVAGVSETPLPCSNPAAPSALSTLQDAILWAVPKRRVSLERRMMRRMGPTRMLKWATPKKNIIECLECGHWHEAHTICGNCYEKVRAETEDMQAQMPENTRLYDTPRSEIVYVYQGEERETAHNKGQYVVEMEKPRPEWWPKNSLTKARR